MRSPIRYRTRYLETKLSLRIASGPGLGQNQPAAWVVHRKIVLGMVDVVSGV